MKFAILSTILILCFVSTIYADINVEITPPVLNDDQQNLQSQLNSQIDTPITDIQVEVTNILDKPALTGAFSSSSTLNSAMSFIAVGNNSDSYTLSVGGAATVYTETFDIDILEEKFNDFGEDSDLTLGLSSDFIRTSITVPHFSLSYGYINYNHEDFFINSMTINVGANYELFKERSISLDFRWRPLKLQGGISYGEYSFGATIKPGVITETIELSPVSFMPPVYIFNLEMDPEIDVSLDTTTKALSLLGSSSLSIFNFMDFTLGGGMNVAFTNSQISVNSITDIVILDTSIIETDGYVDISGSIEGESSDIFMAFLFSSIQFNISSFFMNIQALYYPTYGLSAGLICGVRY